MIDFTQLMPEFTEKLKEFVLEANYEGLHVDVESAFRSMDEQQKLYNQGRTTPGHVVTNAKPGQSWHNYGVAADVVFRDSKGNWNWSHPDEDWVKLAAIARKFDLEWGGSWSTFHGDTDHFQYTRGYALVHAMTLPNKESVWEAIRNNGNV